MSGAAFSVAIFVEERAGLARDREALRIGVPLPRGLLADAAGAAVVDANGVPVSHQARALMLWPDQSIKWLLVDALVSLDANTRTTLYVQPASRAPDPDAVTVVERGDEIEVDTGAARFVVSRRGSGPVKAVQIGGTPLLRAPGSRVRALGLDGLERVLQIDSLVIEERGAVRISLLAEGTLASGAKGTALRVRSRLTLVAGSAALRLDLLVHNPQPARHSGGLWDLGDPGSQCFEDLSLCVAPAEVRELTWCAEGKAGAHTQPASQWTLYQDSSGGERWDSPNHLDRNGRLSVAFRGYRVSGSREPDTEAAASGHRATPYLAACGTAGWVAAGVADFWQNFPKALRWTGTELALGLFPGESVASFELQGGEQKRHTLWLDFGLPGVTPGIERLQNPLLVSLDPEWVAQTRAVPWLVPARRDRDAAFLAYIQNIVEGPESFSAKRERIDEYGWRNFGDLYADHEAVRSTGERPLVSHYNNQYDFIYGALVQFLRSGDHRWRELMEQSARHTIDIDIYHTDADKAAFNGGLFWHTDHYMPAQSGTHRTYSARNGGAGYGGGPSNEHNYTSGLLGYHLLTGDAEARRAVLELAEWVIAMDDGSRTVLALIDASPTGYASKTVSESYHKAGRGAGNSINALLDAYALSRDQRYMAKAQQLIERCIHPADDVAALGLAEPEYRWSYLVFLQVLAKYLDFKSSLGEIDYAFYYARDSFLRYARWMLEHEVPYKDVLHKVELPTETWPAQDVRKSHILHVAATYAPAEERARFHERAAYFFERCIGDLLSFDTALLTRPLVLLAVYGHIHAYFEAHPDVATAVTGSHGYCFGTPAEFVPQKRRVRQALREKSKLAGAEVRRLVIDALSSVVRTIRRSGGRS